MDQHSVPVPGRTGTRAAVNQTDYVLVQEKPAEVVGGNSRGLPVLFRPDQPAECLVGKRICFSSDDFAGSCGYEEPVPCSTGI